ncbi:MAG: COX15/CtaA family protein [Alphaproteobacteria bacterium]
MAESRNFVPLETPGARAVGIWLLVCCALVFAMVVLGGVTRLTGSGLSMVDWRPLMGTLPPLSQAEWQAVFDLYKAFPEYQKINAGMTLAEFKGIFWFEYTHRLLGRGIGVVFLLPFLWFLSTGRLRRDMSLKLAGMFVLGGLQGLMGWYMVKSGLVDDPHVSQYRLAAHLALAILVYALMLWMALGLLRPDAGRSEAPRAAAWGLVALISITVFSGALVAGLDAGLDYNTFPLMDGRFVPEGYLAHSPAFINVFETIAAVQFNHRWLGVGTGLLILAFVWRLAKGGAEAGVRRAAGLFAAMALVQPLLGILTLLLVVPVSLAAIHQAGALLLFTAALWTAYELRRPPA